MARARARLLQVAGSEQVGPYTLLRLHRGGAAAGRPGQFFMLEAPGRLLPRPMSVCLVSDRELAFLIDPVGPGTRALCSLSAGETLRLLGPLGNGFRLDVPGPVLVGGGIGVAPLPYLSERLGRPRALLGFRSSWHAEAAALVPNAEVVVDPRLVTELLPVGEPEVLACGPEPMLRAVARIAPRAQLAWEAPMACGYGACYGCAVEIDGRLGRLCVDGPVLNGGNQNGGNGVSPVGPLAQNGGNGVSPVGPLADSSCRPAPAWAPAERSSAPPSGTGSRSNAEGPEGLAGSR